MQQRATKALWNGGMFRLAYRNEDKRLVKASRGSLRAVYVSAVFAKDPSLARLTPNYIAEAGWPEREAMGQDVLQTISWRIRPYYSWVQFNDQVFQVIMAP